MKRLCSLIIVVSVTAFAVIAPVRAASDRELGLAKQKVNQNQTGAGKSSVQQSNDEQDGGLLGFNPYLKNYLPIDLRLVGNDSVGATCNENGALEARVAEKGKFRCMEYISHSARERYRIRYATKDEGMGVFNYIKGKPVFYASFTPNPEPWKGDRINHYSKVIDQSEKARKYALAHSDKGDETPVVVDKSTPTAPATPSTPTTSILDCSHGNLFEKAQCIAKNAAANKL